MDQYTIETALKHLTDFMNPLDSSVSDEQRAAAFAAFEQRTSDGVAPKEAFELTVNEVYADRETDDGVRENMRDLCTEEEFPATWTCLWELYQSFRETFCPYVAFQLYLHTVSRNSKMVAGWFAKEETTRRMVEGGIPPHLAMALYEMMNE